MRAARRHPIYVRACAIGQSSVVRIRRRHLNGRDRLLTTDGMRALIALEDDSPDFLFARLSRTQLPIWPYLRISFSRAMAATELGTVGVPRRTTRAREARRVINSYLPDFSGARYRGGAADIFHVVSGVTVTDTENGAENWLVDRFASATDARSIVIQDRGLDTPRRQRVHPPTYTFDASLARVEVGAKFAPLSAQETQLVTDVIRQAADAIEFELADETVSALIAPALYALSRARHVDRQYERVLDRMRPKVVLMEDASYGSRASVVSLMKDRGIHVAEPQHGWIGASHAAYNFGAAMTTPSLRKTLPDTVLTFGEYWSSSIRHPATILSIGKPSLEVRTMSARPLSERPRELAVVSSVADPEGTAALVLAIRNLLPTDWRVVFRAHPSERSVLSERYPTLVGAERVDFDEHDDAYDTLLQVRGVVGLASTVLYEALAFGCHVFVMKSEFAPYYVDENHFGELIDGTKDLPRIAATLLSPEVRSPSADVRDAIWKPRAEENFESFISNLLHT